MADANKTKSKMMDSKPWTMHPSTIDDEAPKDPRICQPTHQEFTEKDFEGHRAHTVFVGVHMPGGRRHSHRRHKHHHRENGDKIPDSERPITPPAQRVQFILGEDIDDGTHESHPLFSEMEELVKEGDEIEWKETARWIKFEEDVEEGGNRWSKPHVATLSLHSLFELRSLILNGTVILDMDASSLETIADLVCENMVNAGTLPINSREKVRDALLRRHRHQHESYTKKKDNNMSRLPIIRSLAEIGRNHSSSKNLQQQALSTTKHAASTHSLHVTTSSTSGLDEANSPSPQTALLSGSNKDQRGCYLAVPTDEMFPSGVLGVTTWFHAGASSYMQPSTATTTDTGGGTSTQVDDHHHQQQQQQQQQINLSSSSQGLSALSISFSGCTPTSASAAPLAGSTATTATTTNKLSGNEPTGSGKYLSVPGKSSSMLIPQTAEEMVKSPSSQSMNRNASSSELNDHRVNTHFMRKIPQGAEASNILVGEVDFLEKTLSAFIRLHQAAVMGDLTEVPVPTRFLFILLGPPGSHGSFHEIGRAMATLMSDEIFHEVAYRARKRDHLLAGIDEFLDAVTVLPPGEWDPTIRIEPPAAIPSQEVRKRPPEKPKKEEVDEEEEEQRLREESGLSRTGRLFGGLVNDVKRKYPWYWSDFKDALSLQCIASWIFLYFACLSPIITFGGLLGEATGKNMAAMESLVSGFVCGMGYGFFSGQPLTILGSTGPVLVFETIVFEFCKNQGWDYLAFRFWIGTWIAIILLILVAIDASALVCYITRFTEENFATLIAFIFIYKAIENVMVIEKKFPIYPTNPYDCVCTPPSGSNDSLLEWARYDKLQCMNNNGSLIGTDCSKPESANVFLMSAILFMGTFTMSIILKDFKNALFFPSNVRQVISDFSVIIAIFSMSALDFVVNVSTPKLEVPVEFKPTLKTRGWLIAPFNHNPFWTAIVAFFPALLGTILIFMDQQITAVIINRKENKLHKGCGYHLDLFVLAILIQICSVMGLPWFVAATVLSINHVNSLKLESECAAPGEKPQFLGVREQRVTHILIFLMIGCSVLLTPLLCHIPMPVLFGVFLYMGVASLKGLQFFDRILIMFMPVKYQPDYMFLRQVPLKRVHLFTLIQLTCLIVLWLIKSFPQTSILFPLMLVVMIGIRKSLDFLFTRRELKILDDIMPEISKRAVEDDMHQLEEGTGEDNVGHGGNLNHGYPLESSLPSGGSPDGNNPTQLPIANGSLVVNSSKMSKMVNSNPTINISEEVNRTTIWKQVNNKDKIGRQSNCKDSRASPKSPPREITISVPQSKKNGKTHQTSPSDKKQHKHKLDLSSNNDARMTTMKEEDDEMTTKQAIPPESYRHNNQLSQHHHQDEGNAEKQQSHHQDNQQQQQQSSSSSSSSSSSPSSPHQTILSQQQNLNNSNSITQV